MKFIITIDDAEENTLKTLINENLDVPLVIGVPAGLIGKRFEDLKIASKDLIKRLIKTLDVEIASHGYYHITPPISKSNNLIIFFTRFPSAYDKTEYVKRALHFVIKSTRSNSPNIVEYDAQREIVQSKYILEDLFTQKIVAFIYPGGYIPQEMIKEVSSTYNFARTSELGINSIKDLNSNPNKFLLKTISISKYTNFKNLQKYYTKLSKLNDDIIMIESYHYFSKGKLSGENVYEIPYVRFKGHIEFLNRNNWQILKFSDVGGVSYD